MRLEQIAATLGASPLKIFFVITIPLAYKGIVAGRFAGVFPRSGRIRSNNPAGGQYPGQDANAVVGNL